MTGLLRRWGGVTYCVAATVAVWLLGASGVRADTVYLTSGITIEGTVLTEDDYEIQIVVSRTESGKIRTVKIVDRSVVERWERDESPLAFEPEPGQEDVAAAAVAAQVSSKVLDLDGNVSKGDAFTRDGRFDEALAVFQENILASEHDLRQLKANDLTPADALTRVMDIRKRSYERAMFAMKGQIDVKKERLLKGNDSIKKMEAFLVTSAAEVKELEQPAVTEQKAGEKEMKRVGSRSPNPSEITRARELRKQMAALEITLEGRKRAMILLEADIRRHEGDLEVMKEQAKQAAQELADFTVQNKQGGKVK